MKTVTTTLPEEAAAFIKCGGIVAFGTETVYGLAANVFDEVAIAKIFEAKQRPADNPLIAHIYDLVQLNDLVTNVTESAQKFIDNFFPGPLTIVLKKQDRIPINATAGLDTIGVRMPNLDSTRRFLRLCEVPVVAPSANISGRPSPTTWQAVLEDLDGRIDCILKGDPTQIGLESTVVDCTGKVPVVLRSGSVSIDDLRSVIPETIAVSGDTSDVPSSPGMKHKHYSPVARVIIVSDAADAISAPENAYIGIDVVHDGFAIKMICRDVAEYAREIFEFLRECDRKGISNVYCQSVSEAGIGTALMDRLRRASED